MRIKWTGKAASDLARLHEQVSWASGAANEQLSNMTARLQSFGADASTMALKQLSQLVRQQATVMAFSDVFLILTALFVGLSALGILMKRPPAAPQTAGGH